MMRQNTALERVLCRCVGVSTCPHGALGLDLERTGRFPVTLVQSLSLQTTFLLLLLLIGLQLFGPSGHFTIFGAKKGHPLIFVPP